MYALLAVTVVGIAVGIYQAGLHLYQNTLDANVTRIIEMLIIDTILVLALVEVIRSLLSYLNEGRVRITVIIETVLIVMLNEIIRDWFEDKPHSNIPYLLGIVAVLMLLRILAIRFSPDLADKQKPKASK